MGRLNIIDTGSSSDNLPTEYNPDASTAKERLQNSLFNPAKAVKDSVENGSINITDAEKTIYENGVMPDVDTSKESFSDFTGEIGDYWGNNSNNNGFQFPKGPIIPKGKLIPDITLFPEMGGKLGKAIKVITAVLVAGFLYLKLGDN